MSAEDNLHPEQFGKYTIAHEGRGLVSAKTPSGRRAGYLSYHHGTSERDLERGHPARPAEVYKAYVSGPHRRKGVATAMLEHARKAHPDLQHSHALHPDGAAWAKARP